MSNCLNYFSIAENVLRDAIDELEIVEQVDTSIEEKSVAATMTMIESNALPAIECIVREIFRIYEPSCYRRSYGRGAGHPLNACPADAPDKNGLLCYPKCRDGYIGVGPVCWQDCTPLKAVGLLCVGSSTVQSSNNDIKRSCPLCLERMPDSTTSYKKTFVRKSYGRGAGSAMVCSSEYEHDGALCYPRCNHGYYGVGPVCWQHCPSSQPTNCGIGCSKTSRDCAKFIMTIIDMAMSILRLTIPDSLIKIITEYILQSATKNDWVSVAGNMSVLSDTFAETILSSVSKKCHFEPFVTMESAVKNASFLLTVVAHNDNSFLEPFLKRFDINIAVKAFDYALCNLQDDFIE